MLGVLKHASLARIPASSLSLLGRLRAYASVQVRVEQAQAWVRWDEPGFEVLRTLLPIPGAEFFENMGEPLRWHLCGHSLPAFDVPETGFVPLATVLTPAPVLTLIDDAEVLPRVLIALRRSSLLHPPTAMLTTPGALRDWADMATEAEFRGLQATRSGDTVLLVGASLPAIAGEKYWGERVLCPLGWRADPDLPESAVLQAVGAAADELALLRKGAVELVPRAALSDLSRASARLAGA